MDATRAPVARRRPPLPAALAITISLLALAWAAQWVPLPGVTGEPMSLPMLRHFRLSIAALGTVPLVAGFLLIELLSFIPPGRRLREAGASGRARLNRAALGLSLAFAAFQAAGIALSLEKMSNPAGLPLVDHPGAAFRILMVATLTAATAATFALATAIGDWGVGNGFCWLVAGGILQPVVRSWWPGPGHQIRGEPAELLVGALWILPLVALAAWVELRRVEVPVSTPAAETLALRLPTYPQGVAPAAWAPAVLGAVIPLWSLLPSGPSPLSTLTPFEAVAGRVLLVPALSLLCFALFGDHRRLASHLRSAAVPAPAAEKILDGQLVRLTGWLTLGSVAVYLIEHFLPAAPGLDLVSIVILTAIALDLRAELEFRRRVLDAVRLEQLDNVHLASCLQALCGAYGIPTLARAQHFRALFYFFWPLVKIDLLVPAERWEEAAALLAAQEIQTV
ncbi:MAG TPA: hypothetical protein VKY89_15945 [Thermoanaerobaculia bacterium]|nr:hypothetical protein [Thermoanaerobaculia bacterium]